MSLTIPIEDSGISLTEFKKYILNDYRIVCESRNASQIARKEVLTGKAKFGIFGDGKELAQIAMAKVFKKGDFRAGYYRDQTFHFASGISTIKDFFHQLYATTDVKLESATAGRGMVCHFGTRSIDDNGDFKNLMEMKNSSSDISCTAGAMPRLLGLAYASKLYKQNPDLKQKTNFTNDGNEVAFGTIGDGSTSEGHFFEVLNAAGVHQVPLLLSVWDDGYAISVPNEKQTIKKNISEILKGFRKENNSNGIEIFTVNGWDYQALVTTYEKAIALCRKEHVPVVIHVKELTQPSGHSTSGSHERYKSKERIKWESDFDCMVKMREWIVKNKISTEQELDEIEKEAGVVVLQLKEQAWAEYSQSIKVDFNLICELLSDLKDEVFDKESISLMLSELQKKKEPLRRDIFSVVRKVLLATRFEKCYTRDCLLDWYNLNKEVSHDLYDSKLFLNSEKSPLNNKIKISPEYLSNAIEVDGREILQACFDKHFEKDPTIVAFGEDVGFIGDVNQGMSGLQEKYGEHRIFDTGIRELSIIGKGIGMAMRGLRPIAEIQYLDYIYYGLQPLADDLSCLSYRTKGGQNAPLIVRTRGHRLEGMWHSGSPMGMLLNSIRGMHLCVPRNMTQAAGMYNLLLRSNEPAIVIETLNAYRNKELMPNNVSEFIVDLGVPEILTIGNDVTIVTYGACVKIALEAAKYLANIDIFVEVIDIQTLLPFDRGHIISKSIEKTNKVLFLDEDVNGGASAYMMQQVLEIQNAYRYLDSKPITLTAKEHRPAYGSDGDYFSKPNMEDIIETVYTMMNDTNPSKFPSIF